MGNLSSLSERKSATSGEAPITTKAYIKMELMYIMLLCVNICTYCLLLVMEKACRTSAQYVLLCESGGAGDVT